VVQALVLAQMPVVIMAVQAVAVATRQAVLLAEPEQPIKAATAAVAEMIQEQVAQAAAVRTLQLLVQEHQLRQQRVAMVLQLLLVGVL
jgi:hypothetical protein